MRCPRLDQRPGQPSTAAPFTTLGQDQLRTIRKLATIFNSSASPLSLLAVPIVSPAPHAPSPRVRLAPVQRAPSARLRHDAPKKTLSSAPRVAPPHLIPATADPAPHRRTPIRYHSNVITPDTTSSLRVAPPHLVPTTAETTPHRRTPLWYHAHIILSNANNPAAPRYPLRSHANCAEANSVIDTNTGQALEYHHLSLGPNKAVWIHAMK